MPRELSDWPKTIVHADMDAFYAAIEQLDNPDLRGKPVLVGPPSDRGVVLTASYEARPYKVGSAMAMAKARRRCPDAVIVRPRFERYTEVSKTIMGVFSDFSPDVEAISLDEAFLDLTGTDHLFGPPRELGSRIKDAVREATGGLTVSVGISGTKYVAKVASDYRKPDGLTIVPPDDAQDWLAPMPVSRLWGVGPKTEKRLHAIGLETIGQVASADPDWLSDRLGRAGHHFYALAHAQDPRRVEGHRRSKSIGSERTLGQDISDTEEIRRYLRRSAEEIGRRLRRKKYLAYGVRVKLKTSGFQILTRQHRRRQPTDVADALYQDASLILNNFDDPGPYRLVGLAAYDLVRQEQTDQEDLFSAPTRPRQLETAIDELKEKFGSNVLRRATDLRKARQTPNLDFLDDDDVSGET